MGLSALLGGDDGPDLQAASDRGGGRAAAPQRVPVEFLRPSPVQPRRHFGEEELEALASSLREHGVLQPLLVRPASRGGAGYEIVAGERRWRAAQRAGLHEVPVVVRELGDREALELALVENVQRADLSPLEEAEAFRRLIDEFGHTQEVLAEAVGKSRSHVANTLRLLGLPSALREMLADGRLTAGHARALLGCAEPERVAALVTVKELNVRQTEELVRRETEQGPAPSLPREHREGSADVADLERQLTASLGLEVGVRSRGRGRGGVLTIRWRDDDQLSFLLGRLR
jgi:ParB family chromosome partitioning protein